jgi:hypothetical protein
MAGLGGRVYDLSLKKDNPMKDKKVISLLSQIRRLETQISKLEKKEKTPSKKVKAKTPVKRKPKKKALKSK